MEANQLTEVLSTIAKEHWELKKQPLLLSALRPFLLERLNGEYKDVLEGESLKAFIKKTGQQSGYQLVEHPTQLAKLGLVPAGVHFEFESELTYVSSSMSVADADAFARVLLALTEEERKAILLPATLVAKLLTAK